MQTLTTNGHSPTSKPTAPAYQACWVRQASEPFVPCLHTTVDGMTIAVESVSPDQFGPYLDRMGSNKLASVLISTDDASMTPDSLRQLRSKPAFERARVYLVRAGAEALAADQGGEFDVEDVLDSHLTSSQAISVR